MINPQSKTVIASYVPFGSHSRAAIWALALFQQRGPKGTSSKLDLMFPWPKFRLIVSLPKINKFPLNILLHFSGIIASQNF